MATFGSILDKPSKSIDRPKPLPTGTYITICKGLPKQDKAKTGTEYVEFNLEIQQPLTDVDAEAIEAAGGVVGKIIRATFYLTEDSVWRLKKFLLDDLELEGEEEEGLRPLISQTMGKQVLATVRHEASQDGKGVFARLADTAPMSALDTDED